MEQQPFGCGGLLNAVDLYIRKPQEIVLVGNSDTPDTRALLDTIHRHYLPNKTVLRIDPQRLEDTLATLPSLRGLLAGKAQVDSKTTAYVCHNFTCSLPITEPTALAALLTGA
jgi:hypothetical protein